MAHPGLSKNQKYVSELIEKGDIKILPQSEKIDRQKLISKWMPIKFVGYLLDLKSKYYKKSQLYQRKFCDRNLFALIKQE